MLRTILLVTGNSSEQAVLAALLSEHHPGLILRGATTADELGDITEGDLADARLIAFNATVAVPAAVIAALGHGAYAFAAAADGSALAYARLVPHDVAFDPGKHTPLSYPRLAYLFWCLAEDLATRPGPLHGTLIDLVSLTSPSSGDRRDAVPQSSPLVHAALASAAPPHRLPC